MTRRLPEHIDKQNGLALLALLSVFVTGSLFFFLRDLNQHAQKIARNGLTDKALATAKTAIIAWSVARSNAPGQLPCPEDLSLIGLPNEGLALSSCPTSTARIGRLPWKTLGLPPDFADSDGNRLWYAVSSGFQNPPINSETPGGLTLDAHPDKAVVLLFSPGQPLNGQDRSVSLVVSEFLDAENSDATPDAFVSWKPAPPVGSPETFNDRVTPITHDDLFTAVERRVANEVLYRLLEYYCDRDNVQANNACRVTPGPGNRFFPRPADFANVECLGTVAIPAGKCLSAATGNQGRIPANPTTAWTATDPLSILRGTTVGGNWFQRNGWRELVHYAVAPACIEGTLDCIGAGFLTLNLPAPAPPLTAQKLVITVGGQSLSALSQDRGSTGAKQLVVNYLEGENASPADNIFQRTAKTGTFNDTTSTAP